MPANKKPKTPGYVQGKDLAKLLHRTPGRITQLTTDGVLKKHRVQEGERYNLVEAIGDFIDHLDNMYSQSQATGLEQKKAEADIRLKDLKAERLELELKEIRGQLHRSEDVEAITNEFVFAVRSALLALPGRLAIDIAPAMTPDEASVRIRKEVSAILVELTDFEYNPEKYKNRVEERLKLQLSAEDGEEKED